MSKNDLTELLDIAKRINHGDYNLEDIVVDKNNELYSIIKYFFDALESLKEISTVVDDEVSKFSIFDNILDNIRKLSKDTVEKIFSHVEKLNMNIDSISENIELLKRNINNDNKKGITTTFEKLKDAAFDGQGLCFDLITFLEFQDVIRNKINKLNNILQEITERLSNLLIKIGIHEGKVDLGNIKDDKQKIVSQDVVDELLREFGL
jgi:chemotaxis protein CheZ